LLPHAFGRKKVIIDPLRSRRQSLVTLSTFSTQLSHNGHIPPVNTHYPYRNPTMWQNSYVTVIALSSFQLK